MKWVQLIDYRITVKGDRFVYLALAGINVLLEKRAVMLPSQRNIFIFSLPLLFLFLVLLFFPCLSHETGKRLLSIEKENMRIQPTTRGESQFKLEMLFEMTMLRLTHISGRRDFPQSSWKLWHHFPITDCLTGGQSVSHFSHDMTQLKINFMRQTDPTVSKHLVCFPFEAGYVVQGYTIGRTRSVKVISGPRYISQIFFFN